MVQITINNLNYKVMLVDPDNKEIRSEDANRINLGKTDCLNQTIYIRNDLNYNRRLSVIIHELTHAFIDAYGFVDIHNWSEEQVCTFNETYASNIVSLANMLLNELK